MSLKVVAGLPGSPAEEMVLSEVSRAVSDGRVSLLALPSAVLGESARATLSHEVAVGVSVATLDGVLQRQWSLYGDGRDLVTPVQRNILVKRALQEALVAPDPGRGAVAIVAALAQRHAAIGGAFPQRMAGLAGRIVDAVRAYRRALDDVGSIEPADAARILASAPCPASTIGIARFWTLRPEQEAVVVGWATGADVWLELPWAPGVAATEGLSGLVARLASAGATIETVEGGHATRPAELWRVATSLYSSDPPHESEGAVRLGVGRGDEGEAEVIGSIVMDLLAEGERPGDIAVAFPGPAHQAGWVARELRSRGVPVQVDAPVPAGQTPFGRALNALWAAAREPVPGPATVGFLRTPFAGASVGDADRVDLLVRGARPRSARAEMDRLRAARGLLAAARLSRSPLNDPSALAWKELADSLLGNAYPGDAPVLLDDALPDAMAHRLFCRTVEELLRLGDRRIGAEDLLEAFRSASVRLRPTPASDPGNDRGAVLVTTLRGLCEARPRNGIIGGLTAGEVPGLAAAEPFEGGAARAAAALGVEMGAPEQGAADRLSFYLAATAPTRSLALTRRESDDEGRALRGSVFWEEFLDLYRSFGDAEPETSGPGPAPEIRRSSAAATRRMGAVRGRGTLADDRVLAELASIDTLSPSQVEAYLRCPYRWFVQTRLRPESPDALIDARLAGSLEHDALAAFYERFAQVGRRVTPDNLARALELAAEVVGEVTAHIPRGEGLVAARLLADVGPAVERTLAADATFLPGYTPTLHEWSFGRGGADEAFDLGGVMLAGRTDRVDVGPEGLVVIDYKRSKVSRLGEFEKEHLVQLQLYAAAASRKLGVPVAGGLYRGLENGKVRGFVLDGVAGPFALSDRCDRTGVDELVEAAIGSALAAAQGMRAGRIEPTPSKDACAGCPAVPFCPQAVAS